MSTKHTPEPWKTGEPEIGYTHDIADIRQFDHDPEEIVAELPIADYDRAIVCVNALAGIPDPAKALEDARKALAPFTKLAAKHWGAETTVTIGMKEYEAALQALCFLTPSQEQP